MKFCVLNGSPKENNSITLQTIIYLRKRFPEHEYVVWNVSHDLKALKDNPNNLFESMISSDCILFSYPVYTFLAPSQLHYFIRFIKESNLDLSGKFVSQITTSKHFYDITAHKYIEENANDLNMKVVKGLSLDMDDLTHESMRKEIDSYFRFLVYSVENNVYEKVYTKQGDFGVQYSRSIEGNDKEKKVGDIVIVTDNDNDESLTNMIDDFIAVSDYKTRVVNLRDFAFQGGCLGCLKCALTGKCIYKDGFTEFLDDILKADAIIYAFRIVDHSLGPLFKMYNDRQFKNGHRITTEGKPTGYLVIGDISSENNLKMVLEARADTGKNYFSGIACDSESLRQMSRKVSYAVENKLGLPRMFYGVGGLKIFRDLIWGMRGIMKDDYIFYKEHKMFDFPQQKRGQMIFMCFIGKIMRNKKIMKKIGNKMNEGMVSSYKKVIDNTESYESEK